MNQIPPELIEDFKQKTGLSRRTLYWRAKQVQEQQGGTIELRVAAGVVAGKEKVETRRYLDKEELRTVREIIAKTAEPPPVVARAAPPVKRTVLQVRGRVLDDPLVPRSVVKDAQRMAELYPVLYMFENSIRAFIRRILMEAFGDDWWEKGAHDSIKNEVADRQARDTRGSWYGKQTGAGELSYTDTAHLAKIVQGKIKLFQPYLKGAPGGVQFLLMRIEEMNRLRRIPAHHNPLAEKQITQVELYYEQWQEHVRGIIDDLREAQ